MIPPVEVRQVRPCRDKNSQCVFLRLGQYHLEDECNICKSGMGRPENTYYLRTDYQNSSLDTHILSKWPCKYNFTWEEMEELIDSGRV